MTPTKPRFKASVLLGVLGGAASLATIIAFGLTLPSLLSATGLRTTAPAVTPTPTPHIETYEAQLPGPCDIGAGLWSPFEDWRGSYHCDSDGLHLQSTPNSGNWNYGINFVWPGHDFGYHYTVETTVTLPSSGDCGGIFTHQTSTGSYSFVICRSGLWYIARPDLVTGTTVSLKSGNVASMSSYHVTVTSDGKNHTFVVGANEPIALIDDTQPNTSQIGLIADTPGGQAVFSDFKFIGYPSR